MKTVGKSGSALLLTVGLVVSAFTAEPENTQTIDVLITERCRDQFYGPEFVDVDAKGKVIEASRQPRPNQLPWHPASAQPSAFKDPRTSISFYVESDGRHLAAIDSEGKLLWVRDPFEDRHMCPYRTPRPIIGRLEARHNSIDYLAILKANGADISHEFLAITFDSSEFGVVDEVTGDFFPEGQN